MSNPVFIDKDAEYLWDYAQALSDDEVMLTLRLSQIAERLERMNERELTRVSKGEFAAGALDMAARIYSRSNLPVEDRAMPVELRRAGLKPTVVPMGATAKKLAAVERKAAAEKKVLGQLSGLKLNLERLRK